MKCPLTPADPKSGSTLLMLHSHKPFCEHISHHVVYWHKLELEQSLLNLLPEPVIHHINVLHPRVVFRILGHSNGRLAVTVDGEFGNVISKFSHSCLNHMTSCPAKLAAIYSVSEKEVATVGCPLLLQLTAAPLMKKA